MTPEQIALVQDSAGRIHERLAEVTSGFYRRLFAANPELRTMFPLDLVLQEQKFADELDTIVRAIPDFPRFLHQVRALGARHAGYGTRVTHYAEVRKALLQSLADTLGPEWTTDVEEAWQAAYDMVAEVMMLGGATTAVRPTIAGRTASSS